MCVMVAMHLIVWGRRWSAVHTTGDFEVRDCAHAD